MGWAKRSEGNWQLKVGFGNEKSRRTCHNFLAKARVTGHDHVHAVSLASSLGIISPGS